MTASTEPLATNAERLPVVRLLGTVTPPSAPYAVTDPEGRQGFLPGSGGVALNAMVGDRALVWVSDHLEPGASLALPEPAANRALQILSCIGNDAFVATGSARGGRGVVIGKHGVTIVAFAPPVLAQLAPGDQIAIDARGVGLAIEGIPDVHLHSTSSDFLPTFAWRAGDRVAVRVVAELASEYGAAGMGFEASWANLDLETHDEHLTVAGHLDQFRFGDLVLLHGHDHRYVRCHDRNWSTVGVIAHGASVAGGHGLGFSTLLSAPRPLLVAHHDADANLVNLLNLKERLG